MPRASEGPILNTCPPGQDTLMSSNTAIDLLDLDGAMSLPHFFDEEQGRRSRRRASRSPSASESSRRAKRRWAGVTEWFLPWVRAGAGAQGGLEDA